MVRVTCDICGKLIADSREDWIVDIHPIVGAKALKYDQENYELCIGDVCQDCVGLIYNYIKEMLDKSTES